MKRTMSRLILLALSVAIALTGLLPARVRATAAVGSCQPDGQQDSGAVYRICMPRTSRWNGDLVIFAHGYVAFNEPLEIPEDQLVLPGDVSISIPDLVNALGFAFATTSYSTNGLAVREGVADLRDLVRIFSERHGPPRDVYLVGASEGGVITALAVEQYPQVFDGGLAACGPIGDFQKQINYWGDFRVVFDYFFPGQIPGSPVDIPPEVIQNWDAVYGPQLQGAIRSNLYAAEQVLRATGAPVPDDSASLEAVMLDLLWYNVFATNDGVAKLRGQPFDNARRLYFGSDSDLRLNLRVQRFHGDATALHEIGTHYQTSGRLTAPLVTMHTTGDHIVPSWHERLYRTKVRSADAGSFHVNLPINRDGHCNFKVSEVLVGFVLLVRQGRGQALPDAEDVLPDDQSRMQFQQLLRRHSLRY